MTRIIDQDDKRLSYISLEQAVVPPAGLIEHLKDRYWSVHPERGVIFFDQSPQCNGSEQLAKRFCCSLYPWAEVHFIPSVFRSINPHDYW